MVNAIDRRILVVADGNAVFDNVMRLVDPEFFGDGLAETPVYRDTLTEAPANPKNLADLGQARDLRAAREEAYLANLEHEGEQRYAA